MPEKPDNPSTFWQELKRRKVVRNNTDEIFEKHGKTGLIEYIFSIEKNRSDSSFELMAALLAHINKKDEALDSLKR
ncbi:MAG: hypothetical protein RQ743_11885 [Bacteroidales bacterium]|nr:hypothetical protein [Bacteroidales bacterium]